VGCQPSRSRVFALDAGMSRPKKCPRKPKWSAASSREYRHDGQAEPAADHFGDAPRRHTFLGDGVMARARDAVLQCETIDFRRVDTMHRRSAVLAVAAMSGMRGIVGRLRRR